MSLKVAHLSCGVSGGADIAAVRIHKALLVMGCDSRFIHLAHESPDNTFLRVARPPSITNLLIDRVTMYKDRYLYGEAVPSCEVFTKAWDNFPLTFSQLKFEDVQVITLHWVAALFDLESFLRSVPSHVKLVWALHDMNPFTGGCHYSGGCSKFMVECERCPQLMNNGFRDLAKKNFSIKAGLYQKFLSGRTSIIADSQWLGSKARESKLFLNFPIGHINYPIETEDFTYRNRQDVRKMLSLPKDKFTLLFGSGALNNRRKGLHLLIEALRLLKEQNKSHNIQVMTFGFGSLQQQFHEWPIRHFETVHNHQMLSMLYNAADYFVMPSLEEALGQTAMESVCSGTPVIAFRTGGIVDTIDESNGILSDAITAEGLVEAIQRAVNQKFDSEQISVSARAKYSFSVKGRQYIDVYNQLVNQ